jgi:hypothetical protein
MRASLKDWENNWFGLELELNPTEIDRLITLLQALKSDPDQHFHISSDYKAEGGLGDIEVSVKQEDKPDNLFLSSIAMAPGDEI